MHKSTCIIAGFLLIIASCKQEEKPLTKEEVHEFARQIEISIDKRDGKILDESIDEKALFKKMNMESGKDTRAMQAGIKQAMKLGDKIVSSMTEKGTYTLLKEYEKDNIRHVLFRLYDQKMINYHDFELTRSNGKPKIADVYIYMTGENFSETLKNLFLQFKDDFKKSQRDESIEWTRKLPKIRSLITAGKHREALDIYNDMPKKAKKNRIFQIIHVEICSGLSDEEYTEAIAGYERLYPNEPNMQLLLIDGYILRKDYDKALTAVNELDKMINKDPLLDFHRAMCYTLMGNDAKRVEYLERLVKNIPDFEDGIAELLVDYLENDEFEKAKPLVDRFKSKSAFDQSTLKMILNQFPGYNEKYAGE